MFGMDQTRLYETVRHTRFDFLRLEVELCCAYIDIAQATGDPARKARVKDTIARTSREISELLRREDFTSEQRSYLGPLLQTLRDKMLTLRNEELPDSLQWIERAY